MSSSEGNVSKFIFFEGIDKIFNNNSVISSSFSLKVGANINNIEPLKNSDTNVESIKNNSVEEVCSVSPSNRKRVKISNEISQLKQNITKVK